jgi:DNA-directed RNA polymerase III subunit RPC6
MASSSRPTSGVDITALRNQLYERCALVVDEHPRMVFHQATLLDLSIIPNDDLSLLLRVVQNLVDDKLFKVVTDTDGVGWKLRTPDEAKKYNHHSADVTLS